MDLLALASLTHRLTVSAPNQAESGGLVINVFWILVVAANFLVFLVAAWYLGLRNLPRNLGERRERIEQACPTRDVRRINRRQRRLRAGPRLRAASRPCRSLPT